MGFSTKLLRAFGWVPQAKLPQDAPDGIFVVSYGGLKDLASVPPLTRSVDRAAANLYHRYQGKPVIIFAVADLREEDEPIEVRVRTDFFQEWGIPVEKIFPAYGTHNSVSEAEQIIRKLRALTGEPETAILCVNDLHARRALPTYERVAGDHLRMYVQPVHCEEYSTSRMPVFWRWLSIRSDFLWAWYMVLTHLAWKLKLIK